MYFDTSMVIDYIIPDSPSDFGVMLFWVLAIVFVIFMIIDIRMYLYSRKTFKKIEKPQQKLDTTEEMKKSKEGRTQEIVEIRNKIDKIIEINKL
jgi:membrane protein implicated in regulation of membrane protease activity